jgi:hypothetical protein
MLCNTSRTGLPAECHVFTIEPVFPSLLARFDIRVFWITSTFLERIMLAIQGYTVMWICISVLSSPHYVCFHLYLLSAFDISSGPGSL